MFVLFKKCAHIQKILKKLKKMFVISKNVNIYLKISCIQNVNEIEQNCQFKKYSPVFITYKTVCNLQNNLFIHKMFANWKNDHAFQKMFVKSKKYSWISNFVPAISIQNCLKNVCRF